MEKKSLFGLNRGELAFSIVCLIVLIAISIYFVTFRGPTLELSIKHSEGGDSIVIRNPQKAGVHYSLRAFVNDSNLLVVREQLGGESEMEHKLSKTIPAGSTVEFEIYLHATTNNSAHWWTTQIQL